MIEIPDISRFNVEGYQVRLVGGWVRDFTVGKKSKDIDLAVETTGTFEEMVEFVSRFGQFVDTVPDKYTVKVKIPEFGKAPTDFVMCRKEIDGKGWQPGSFHDDMVRRDFTCNAMAMSAEGVVIDLFRGQKDMAKGILRCVGDPFQRFSEDADRFGRAFRFASVNRWELDIGILEAMNDDELMESFAESNSDRRGEEFNKALKDDPVGSMALFASLPAKFQDAYFANGDDKPAFLQLHFSKKGKH